MQTTHLHTRSALPPVEINTETIKQVLDSLQQRCEANTRAYRSGAMPDNLPEAAKKMVVVPRSDSTSSEPITFFHSQQLPGSSLHEFGTFVCCRRMHCEPVTTGIAATLFQRFAVATGLPVTALMMHRLFVACTVVAAKVHQDNFPTNKLLAKHAGVPHWELNRLEQTLVQALDWRVLVTREHMQLSIGPLVLSTEAMRKCVETTSERDGTPAAKGDSAGATALLRSEASSFFAALHENELSVSTLPTVRDQKPAATSVAVDRNAAPTVDAGAKPQRECVDV